MAILIVLFYCVMHKYAQESYITVLYSTGGNRNVDNNLLSERGHTMESNVKDTLFNPDVERIAMQNTLGMIYYICAFDCGFDFYGFMMCFSRVKDRIVIRAGDSRKIE